eukprot:COSAG03_NODE_940_length_5258_cov_1.998255_3_plen_201_part_00
MVCECGARRQQRAVVSSLSARLHAPVRRSFCSRVAAGRLPWCVWLWLVVCVWLWLVVPGEETGAGGYENYREGTVQSHVRALTHADKLMHDTNEPVTNHYSLLVTEFPCFHLSEHVLSRRSVLCEIINSPPNATMRTRRVSRYAQESINSRTPLHESVFKKRIHVAAKRVHVAARVKQHLHDSLGSRGVFQNVGYHTSRV